jgi:hypothetical protein
VVSTGAPLLVEQTLDVPANDPAPVYAQRATEPSRSHRRSYGGGGGGGDLDPITILTIVGSLPIAWQLRRRRA